MKRYWMIGILIVVAIAVVFLALSGPESDTKDMSLGEFREKLRTISYFPKSQSDYHFVISKQKLIQTFGEPSRVQQFTDGSLQVCYPLKDGLAYIKGLNYFWDGKEKYQYVDDESNRPKHQVEIELKAKLPESNGKFIQGNGISPEYKKIYVDWYLETHENPYKVCGPVQQTDQNKPALVGQYYVTENGKYIYTDGDSKEKAVKEAWVLDRLSSDAERIISSEIEEIKQKYEAGNTKTIDEPCLVITGGIECY